MMKRVVLLFMLALPVLLLCFCAEKKSAVTEAVFDWEGKEFVPDGATLLSDYRDIDTSHIENFTPWVFCPYKQYFVYSEIKANRIAVIDLEKVEVIRRFEFNRAVQCLDTDSQNNIIVAAGQYRVYVIDNDEVIEFNTLEKFENVLVRDGRIYAVLYDYRPGGFRGFTEYDLSLKKTGVEIPIPEKDVPEIWSQHRKRLAWFADDILFLYYHMEDDYRLIDLRADPPSITERMCMIDDPAMIARARHNYDTYSIPDRRTGVSPWKFFPVIPASFQYGSFVYFSIKNFRRNSIVVRMEGGKMTFFELAGTGGKGESVFSLAVNQAGDTLYITMGPTRAGWKLRAYDLDPRIHSGKTGTTIRANGSGMERQQ